MINIPIQYLVLSEFARGTPHPPPPPKAGYDSAVVNTMCEVQEICFSHKLT